jgi:hypothetical protein
VNIVTVARENGLVQANQSEAFACRHICAQKGRNSTINGVLKIQEVHRVLNIRDFHVFTINQ